MESLHNSFLFCRSPLVPIEQFVQDSSYWLNTHILPDLYQIFWHKYYNESADTSPFNVIFIQQGQAELEVRNLLDSFDLQNFDEDILYSFSDFLKDLVQKHGRLAINIINKLINQNKIDNNIAYETLKAIGRMTNDDTKPDRFQLLAKSLENKAAIIRDGAIIGLSLLDDRKAIPLLRLLGEKENIPTLKENIKIALKDLETT